MKKPDFLKKGDLVAIVCPASYAQNTIEPAIKLLESWGLRIQIGKTVSGRFHHFSGTDEERVNDFQNALDNHEVKAVFAARGGYGTVRIIDKIDFSNFAKEPKWLIGFSDITVLHSHIQASFGIPTIHGQMPLTMPDGTPPSLETLRQLLFGGQKEVSYRYPRPSIGRNGKARGILTGGNLALLASITGSDSDADLTGKILFLEDVGEIMYNIDRLFWTLSRAGKLKNLKGLILGGFTALKDTDPAFGMTIEEIVMEKIQGLDYPVAFDFPAGHVDDNRAMIFGEEVVLEVNEEFIHITYSN